MLTNLKFWYLKRRLRQSLKNKREPIFPREVVDVLPFWWLSISTIDMVNVLKSLEREHFLYMRYKISRPDGKASNKDFLDPRDIPDKLDDGDITFDTPSSDVIVCWYRFI